MQGGGGDPLKSGCPFGGYGGSFGESGGSNNGTPILSSFGGPNNGPPRQMSSVSGGDAVDGFRRSNGGSPSRMSNGRSNGGSPSRMSNVSGGDAVDGFGRSSGGSPRRMSNVLGGDSVGGFGGSSPPSPMSDFLRGRDPFDDPFFTQPFGGNMSQPSLFGPPTMDPIAGVRPPPLGFTENPHHQPPQPRQSGGPTIEEITVLDDEQEGEVYQEARVILGKHGRSSSDVEMEEAIAEERRIRHMQNMNANAMVNSGQWQPQTQGYSFQSSSVTYGGLDGNYYTSSTTRRTGSDGLTLEESNEANTATRGAAHRISRGFNNQGHTVERTRNSDGRVNTNQVLLNLNEAADELAGFEQSSSSNAGVQMQFPGPDGSVGSDFINREQTVLLPPTDPSPSRARRGPYRHRRRNATDFSKLRF
ncbi:hypothetical protein Bca52824_090788 [Brassica carinata]|uniref:Uncharacterized protein n=1 Tax=Brassica carinata TaxID=52824 RepID=A0A8X7NX53_BRACI|nr:hypothetical protein Bca52824_090788 [Brassica carinata]